MTPEQRLNHYLEHIDPLVREIDALIRSKNPKFTIGASALITILCTQIEATCENSEDIVAVLTSFLFRLQDQHFNILIRESN